MITAEREQFVKERAAEAKRAAQVAYDEARQRFLAEIDGETPAERTQRKAAAHSDMVAAERQQQAAYQRELTGRAMSNTTISMIVQAVDQYGGASAWQLVKQSGHEADAAYELPDHVLEAMKPYADADTLPRPTDATIALFRDEIMKGNLGAAREAMGQFARNWLPEDVLLEQQARSMRRAASREQHRVSFVDHRRLAPGERLHVDVQADTVERQDTQAPVTAPQTPVHAAETQNKGSDTTSPTSAPQNAIQRATEGDGDGETARIIELAGQGLSRRRICQELYGVSGGRAYARVRNVLDAAGL